MSPAPARSDVPTDTRAGARVLAPVPDPAGAPQPYPADAGTTLAEAVAAGELELPRPGHGATAHRWARLAALGRRDLPTGRLAEGHTDAVAILAELGRDARAGTVYGVWASKAGGGARLSSGAGGPVLRGTVRFCSGTHVLDRALVVASADDGAGRVVDLDLRDPLVRRRDAWRAAGMAASDTHDVVLHDVVVPPDDVVGGPDAYTGRTGFAHGGAGVAAVWLGGAAGIVDEVAAGLRGGGDPDPHRLAGLGTLCAAVAGADALLAATATAIDAQPGDRHRRAVATVRAAVERACRTVLDTAPEVAGVSTLAGSDRLAARLADLQVYLRQHHGGRDLAELGRAVLDPDDDGRS